MNFNLNFCYKLHILKKKMITQKHLNEILMTPGWRGTCFIKNMKCRPNKFMSPLDTFENI